jgi:hypothetical protein
MPSLSDLSRLSEKMTKVEGLLRDYQERMAVNNPEYGLEASTFGNTVDGERKFLMFEDLWVSSRRKVGR